MTHAPSSAGRHHRALVITLVLTAGYLVAEIVGATLTGSLALLADAGHMFTDVGGLALAIAGLLRPCYSHRVWPSSVSVVRASSCSSCG